jgi:hypothetical protein
MRRFPWRAGFCENENRAFDVLKAISGPICKLLKRSGSLLLRSNTCNFFHAFVYVFLLQFRRQIAEKFTCIWSRNEALTLGNSFESTCYSSSTSHGQYIDWTFAAMQFASVATRDPSPHDPAPSYGAVPTKYTLVIDIHAKCHHAWVRGMLQTAKAAEVLALSHSRILKVVESDVDTACSTGLNRTLLLGLGLSSIICLVLQVFLFQDSHLTLDLSLR